MTEPLKTLSERNKTQESTYGSIYMETLENYLIYKKTPSRPIFVSCPQASGKQDTSPHLTEGRHVNILCLGHIKNNLKPENSEIIIK